SGAAALRRTAIWIAGAPRTGATLVAAALTATAIVTACAGVAGPVAAAIARYRINDRQSDAQLDVIELIRRHDPGDHLLELHAYNHASSPARRPSAVNMPAEHVLLGLVDRDLHPLHGLHKAGRH